MAKAVSKFHVSMAAPFLGLITYGVSEASPFLGLRVEGLKADRLVSPNVKTFNGFNVNAMGGRFSLLAFSPYSLLVHKTFQTYLAIII